MERRKNTILQLLLLFSSAWAFVPEALLRGERLPQFRSQDVAISRAGTQSASSRLFVSSVANNNFKYSQKAPVSRQQRKKTEEFQWLNWVYKQWRGTKPGELSEEVLKQMAPAISRWGKRRTSYSGERAEELLERIVTDHLAGNSHAELTVSLFNAAMDAYAKIGDPVGVQRILRRMETLRQEHPHLSHLRSDVFSMSTLATAWAKSRSPDAAAKAEGILRYMEVRNLTPNTITYNAVLHAMAVSNQIDKAIRAEDLVKQMKKRHASGEDCEPDLYSFQSVIQAWSRTCLPGSPQRAEQILLYLDEESEKGNKNLSPNVYCFTTTIHAWSRSAEQNRARNAYHLLNHMRKRYAQSRSKKVKPNVVAFTAVLNACANPAHDSEKEDAFAIAQLAMSELSLGDMDKPNFLSFAAFLATVSSTIDDWERRDIIAEDIFKQCTKAGQVGLIVLDKLKLAASPELFDRLVGRYIDEDGNANLPMAWTACIQGERNTNAPTSYSVTEPLKIQRSAKLRLKAAQKFGGQSGSFTTKRVLQPLESEGIEWSQESLYRD